MTPRYLYEGTCCNGSFLISNFKLFAFFLGFPPPEAAEVRSTDSRLLQVNLLRVHLLPYTHYAHYERDIHTMHTHTPTHTHPPTHTYTPTHPHPHRLYGRTVDAEPTVQPLGRTVKGQMRQICFSVYKYVHYLAITPIEGFG